MVFIDPTNALLKPSTRKKIYASICGEGTSQRSKLGADGWEQGWKVVFIDPTNALLKPSTRKKIYGSICGEGTS